MSGSRHPFSQTICFHALIPPIHSFVLMRPHLCSVTYKRYRKKWVVGRGRDSDGKHQWHGTREAVGSYEQGCRADHEARQLITQPCASRQLAGPMGPRLACATTAESWGGQDAVLLYVVSRSTTAMARSRTTRCGIQCQCWWCEAHVPQAAESGPPRMAAAVGRRAWWAGLPTGRSKQPCPLPATSLPASLAGRTPHARYMQSKCSRPQRGGGP